MYTGKIVVLPYLRYSTTILSLLFQSCLAPRPTSIPLLIKDFLSNLSNGVRSLVIWLKLADPIWRRGECQPLETSGATQRSKLFVFHFPQLETKEALRAHSVKCGARACNHSICSPFLTSCYEYLIPP